MAIAGTPTSQTLAERIVPRQGILHNTTVFNMLLTLAGTLFVALLAQIRIGLPWDVPITGQTLGVLLVGSVLGSRLGLVSLLLYVALGSIGLPFYAGGQSGMSHLFGPTAGYLFSYPIVAALMGWLAERGWDRKVTTTVLGMGLGNLIIYGLGVLWLAQFPILGQSAPRGLEVAFATGALPFLIGDAIKIAIAAGVLPGAWKLIGSEKKRDR